MSNFRVLLPVVAVVVRAAAQMVVLRSSSAPGRRARRVHRTVGHERNGGVCFMRGAQASTITRDWLNELASNPGPGGTDQMPLRRVLWRHREHLFDLPSRVQCRCRKESICENGALLWHLHRIYRLDVLRRVGNASEMCGFVP